MSNVSLLGHLCGILSGFACQFSELFVPLSCHVVEVNGDFTVLPFHADTYGLFNLLMPGTSFYSAIEASSWLVSTLSD